MEKFLRCFTPPNMRKTIPDKIFFGIGRVRYLYSALLFLMFFCLFSLDAASNDYILAGNVKITDKLKSYGYIEIEIPIYDDNGADEAVKPGSYVAINENTVFEFASEHKAGEFQNDDSWYWAKAKLHSGSAAKVRTYVTASKRGYSANTWYDVTTKEEMFPYSKVQGRTSAIYQIYPNVSDLQKESLSLAIFVKPDQNSGSDAPDFTVRHSSTNLNMKADVPTLNWSYSNTFGQFIVSFNGTSGDQYKLTG